jgi:hypothetical protein
MKATRYFRDKGTYWNFEDGKRPLTKAGFYSPWRSSFFRSLDEFQKDPVKVEEVESGEAEEQGESEESRKSYSRFKF